MAARSSRLGVASSRQVRGRGDLDQEMSSICDRLLALPDDTIVLPGHMDQTTIGDERARNPYVQMELAKRAGG